MDSVRLDTVDLALLHALQIDGRAPFSRIAEVLDVSDRTIARRFARLRAQSLARVCGVPDSSRIGQSEWLVRLRVRAGGADIVARDLARRPDTAWVTVLAGGAEVMATLRVDGERPLPALSVHSQVLAVDTQRLLRHLTELRWRGRTSALSAEQAAALGAPEPDAAETITLTDLDRRLLPALARDGRADYPSLAQAAGWSESAVRRRLDELRRQRVVRFDVEIDAATLGFPVHALLWLNVAPARLAGVAQTLAGHSEVAFAGATTGAHNLLAIVVCRDAAALFDYLTVRIGAIEGIEHMESAPITAITKRAAPTA
ncbi:Lrp/AsnC family transcriptional regulator [Nocardia sp. XZ_19_385]|uniref:Lrp/AsnC family transcriptional regulator n=1 Tax=Nocardia sp. XZ_19_385 TaxID=2769488 RepID=UPI0018909B22|nr:Lrp/AsnC family transcriptional regulator [Nocardia sp. XZ_19_385]